MNQIEVKMCPVCLKQENFCQCDITPPDFILKSDITPTHSMAQQVGGDHYRKMHIQPVVFINRNGLNFIEGSVVKYVCRHRDKGGRKDIEKAIHYLELLLDLEYNEGVK